MLFSIIIPTYNRADFLLPALQSVQTQTYKDFEVVVVDDGSTDKTKELIANLAKGDNRIKYIYQQNAERGAARNNGFKNASGDFVVFFDSDDEMDKNYLKLLYNQIHQNQSSNFYAAKYNYIDGEKIIKGPLHAYKQGLNDINVVLTGNPFCCNVCVKRSNPALRLFNEDRKLATMEDWMFLVENLQHDKIFIIDAIGLNMSQHDNRSMQQNQFLIERRLLACETLLDKLSLSIKQQKTMKAYSFYFCGIHAYLDLNRPQAMQFIKKAIAIAGPNKLFALTYLKFLMGRKLIERVQSLKRITAINPGRINQIDK